MGVGDVSLKKWLGKKERFADLFNGTVFGGDHVVHSEELKEAPREHDIIIKDKNNKARVVQRYRDIIMNWHGTILAVLAIESQEKVNYIMPVRSMIYDGLAYMEQIDKAWNELPKEQRAKVKKEEFISKYRKGQKLTPAITLVFYYGSKKWDGARDIYHMLELDMEKQQELKKWIPNYHINLIDVNNINNIKNFEKDLQTMFGMLKYKKDKNKLRNYICHHAEYFNSLDEYGYGTVAALLGEGERFLNFVSKELKEHKEREEEVPIVCKAIDDIYNDGIKLGRREGKREGKSEGIKIGEKRGEERGRAETRTQIARNMLEQGMGLKEVVAYTKITKKEKEALVAELQIV